MALKRTLSKAQYDKLTDELKKEYKENGEGYELDLEGGFEDTGALKRAKEHEAKARKDAEKKAADAEAELETLRNEKEDMLRGAVPKADVEKLEKSLGEKHARELAKKDGIIAERERELTGSLVESVATSMAAKISSAPTLILPHIKSRLKAELKDGKPVTVILDKDGKASASTVEDLEKEFLDNKDFASIITGSKGSGGGAAGSGKSGGGAIKSVKDFKNATEESIFANKYPAEYAKLEGATAGNV